MLNESPIKLVDFKKYPFFISDITLDFKIFKAEVYVESLMLFEPKLKESINLFLHGNDINLLSISIDGRELESKEYHVSDRDLVIYRPPLSKFKLKISSKINPFTNTSLEGLYSSSGMLTTQCEAEGFRRICFHPDRPDVLSKYLVRIEADRCSYPILLSNGNLRYSGKLKSNSERHEVVWHDPFPKPSYLFALVAGDLNVVSDKYITNSGRSIDINLYVEDGDEKYTKHAIKSLKKAMEWDEKKYQLEYDLNDYKIVAVRHFNMGAMENKGLNIFNSKLVLADSKTATDAELERIESVIAHEYFHNWTGNRITCRDWFQLSLKEGLTVYRDQSFTADLHNPGLKRIEDVSFLRNFQFTEDSGPTSHAVKPKEYVAIDNFYTTTIYEKGAELIRMLEILLGKDRFMKGIKVFIDTFDGCAATTEDFIKSIVKGAYLPEDKSYFNVEQFQNWYYKSGTPKVYVNQSWDPIESTLKISLEQKFNSQSDNENHAMVIPIIYSCYNKKNNTKPFIEDKLFILDQQKKDLIIKGSDVENSKPVLSIFRRFSAPIICFSDLSIEDHLFLFLNDNDYFSMWDSGQYLMHKIIKNRINNQIDHLLEVKFINAIRQSIKYLQIKDPFFLATLLTIPGLSELENSFERVNPISIYKECLNFQISIGQENHSDFRILSKNLLIGINQDWPKGKGERKLLGKIWSYLAFAGDDQVKRTCVNAIDSPSMTISRAALTALKSLDCPETKEASNLFYVLWKDNPVVLDSWFSYEASRSNKDAINVVEGLLSHPKFDWMAPNAIRAVLGGFSQNIESFHSLDGCGYMFMAEKLIEVDKRNPITASKMAKVFSRWRTFIDQNKDGMYKAISKINQSNISSNTREVVELILK